MNEPVETMWQGRFIVAKRQGKWEYVGRSRGIRAAVIVAIDDGHVILVEQYRVPLGAACIELPESWRAQASTLRLRTAPGHTLQVLSESGEIVATADLTRWTLALSKPAS